MRCILLFNFLIVLTFQLVGQNISTSYEPSVEYPFGRYNPDAPKELKDFEPMIGICDCKSLNRNPDGTWQDTAAMVWKFKYIMNGTAVQDEVWRPDNNYAGSIRQYQADSSSWVVTYFSYPFVSTAPGVWLGEKSENEIVLKMDQKAPNGMDGISRLTFYDMSKKGFNWKGEWVSTNGSVVYPFWMIWCTRRE